MKRYLVFAYDDYYPAGGMGDFYGDYDTIVDVVFALGNISTRYENIDVYDQEKREMVKQDFLLEQVD